MKRLFGYVMFAVTLSTMAGCAVRSYSRFGPAPREAMVAPPHAGLVWIPSYNRWTGHNYRRVEGGWVMPPRRGQVWVPGYRASRRGGYVWVEGYWR
jgi:predicted small lipoprotein YifL